MRPQFTDPQPPERPASRALAILLAAEDSMSPADHADVLYTRRGGVVVILGSREAWVAWLIEVRRRGEDVRAQASEHLATAEALVCGCPVMLVCGDCPEDVPPCTCAGALRHAVTKADKARVEGLRKAAGRELAEYYGEVLAECRTSKAASALAVAA